MKRTLTILLSMVLGLMIEPLLGPWRAQNRASQVATARAPRTLAPESRSQPSLAVELDAGSFVLTDLRLTSVGGSTKMTGKLVNRTQRAWEQLVFTLRAYDQAGRLLKGIERETIFGVNRLAKGKSAALNSGYGVWLEGIPLNAIARVEVLLEDQPQAAHGVEGESQPEIEE